jgi:acyl phosphate:glycerol-3-phosphate acyltransferase
VIITESDDLWDLQYNYFMVPVLFIGLAFLCGSLPFSVWLGRFFLRRDIRSFGDGNPGAANVFRSGSKLVGTIALILDVCKSAIPVGVAYVYQDIRGLPMFIIAIAPILGHMFSPFLAFRGGKAIATTLGVWIGLTLWTASLPGVITAIIGIALFMQPGWAVLFALMGIMATLLVWVPEPLLFYVLGAQILLLSWAHRSDLSHWPQLRPWLARHVMKGKNGRPSSAS